MKCGPKRSYTQAERDVQRAAKDEGARALLKMLTYDPFNGLFFWLSSRGRAKAGAVAGTLNAQGYVAIQMGGAVYKAHRLAWLWAHGSVPAMLDHINGDKADNRLCNLRASSPLENSRNRREHREGRLWGATYHKVQRRWTAQFWIGRTKHYAGGFATEREAHEAAINARREIGDGSAEEGGSGVGECGAGKHAC